MLCSVLGPFEFQRMIENGTERAMNRGCFVVCRWRDQERMTMSVIMKADASASHRPHSCACHRNLADVRLRGEGSPLSPRTWAGWIPVTSTGMRAGEAGQPLLSSQPRKPSRSSSNFASCPASSSLFSSRRTKILNMAPPAAFMNQTEQERRPWKPRSTKVIAAQLSFLM
ncbi:hypothetical protein SAMN05428983_0075 [Agrobacterium fabrum]|uniref:Uncharacterized protein n=1 Tax=Agrobacterium fabrum TaxID=1176649 RepID=A0A7Z7BF08_9HYPH|nr:hypothetical protein SAMN05428983_0075 [Agrobacterium fabrum]